MKSEDFPEVAFRKSKRVVVQLKSLSSFGGLLESEYYRRMPRDDPGYQFYPAANVVRWPTSWRASQPFRKAK